MTHGAQILRQILTQAQQGGSKKLYVFDLDSTLFDVSPRIQKIIHDFTLIPEHIAEFPEEVEILKTIELEKTDWGIKNAFFRAGLDKQHPSFYEKVRGFWFQRFFSNDYLQYDVPYEGALNYVEALRKTGNDIVYLTGRDEIRMGKGSRETLLSVGFPLDGQQSRLVLKPNHDLIDHEFKKDWFLTLPRNEYSEIWFFENEPLNIELIQAQASFVKIVFFDSTHSGKAEKPTQLPKIMHYLMDDKAD